MPETRRAITTRIKAILKEQLGIKVSVRLGKGTAYHWVEIETPDPSPSRYGNESRSC